MMDTEFLDVESEQAAPTVSRPLLVDRERGQIFLLSRGSVVRSFLRSRWTLTV
jgi:hypothetical protein